MSTLADLNKNAEKVVTFVDDATPAGYFGASAKVLGIFSTYLFKGVEGDESAEVVGRVEIPKGLDLLNTSVYVGNGLKGGEWSGRLTSYSEAFAKMV